MIVRLSESAAALTDLDRLDRLHAEVDGPIELVQPADWYDVDDAGSHVWLDVARCREIGRSAHGDHWVDRYDAMVAYACSKGWTDDDGGRVRAHVVPRDADHAPHSGTRPATDPPGA